MTDKKHLTIHHHPTRGLIAENEKFPFPEKPVAGNSPEFYKKYSESFNFASPNAEYVKDCRQYESALQQAIEKGIEFEDQKAAKIFVWNTLPSTVPFDKHLPPNTTYRNVSVGTWEKVEQWYSGYDKKWIDSKLEKPNGVVREIIRLVSEPKKEEKIFPVGHEYNPIGEEKPAENEGKNNFIVKEALPCPFCNTQPEWVNEALHDSHFYIRCPECRIEMKADRRDKVVGLWNRRDFSKVPAPETTGGKENHVEYLMGGLLEAIPDKEVAQDYVMRLRQLISKDVNTELVEALNGWLEDLKVEKRTYIENQEAQINENFNRFGEEITAEHIGRLQKLLARYSGGQKESETQTQLWDEALSDMQDPQERFHITRK